MPQNNPRKLSEIADEIFADWKRMAQDTNGFPHPAKPYAEAMRELEKVTDNYLNDSAEGIVGRFLINANGWRGEKARQIKAELRAMITR